MKKSGSESGIVDIPLHVLLRLLEYFALEDGVKIASTCRFFHGTILEHWSPREVSLDYAKRQKIRRHLFRSSLSAALPSHFTHIFLTHTAKQMLGAALFRPGGLTSFVHHRSDKTMKLHHPYFYRQLPLAINPDWPLPEPVLDPNDVPLPHDLSLCDIMYILLLNSKSLENINVQSYDAAPLPWNSSPSRICPREILGSCFLEQPASPGMMPSPPHLTVWCPDCKPVQGNHDKCWTAAGNLLTSKLVEYAGPVLEAELKAGLAGREGPSFPQLKSLVFSGWSIVHFLAILRVFGCCKFPQLENFELRGTVIVATTLTSDKDAVPRPTLRNENCPSGTCPMSEKELKQKLAQIICFQASPYARRYTNALVEEYWLGHFNGHLWTPESFPKLKRVAIRVGNFDDSCRWIIPMMENCFGVCPELETIEVDHTILRPFARDNSIFKMLSLSQVKMFPKLRTLKLRMIESTLEMIQIQESMSQMLERPIILKTRKLYCRLAHRFAKTESALAANWVQFQKKQIRNWLALNPNISHSERDSWLNLTDEDLSIWADTTDRSAMMVLSFDSLTDVDLHTESTDSESTLEARLAAKTARYGVGWDYGCQVQKVALKHFTPTNPVHRNTLEGIKFGSVGRRSRLKRLTVQLDMPHVWHLQEDEAKLLVAHEIDVLKEIILAHEDLKVCSEIRVMSCTRLTYGGTNWSWWESLICGRLRRRQQPLEVEGWARESKEVITPEELRSYSCDHIWSHAAV